MVAMVRSWQDPDHELTMIMDHSMVVCSDNLAGVLTLIPFLCFFY